MFVDHDPTVGFLLRDFAHKQDIAYGQSKLGKEMSKFFVTKFSKTIVLSAVALGSSLLVGESYAAATIGDARISYVGFYGNGNFFVLFDKTLAEPGCSAARIDVQGTHPQSKAFLAIAMAAKINSLPVLAASGGCFSFTINSTSYTFPTLDTTNATYIGFMP